MYEEETLVETMDSSYTFNPTSSEVEAIMFAARSFNVNDDPREPTRRRATVDVTSPRPVPRNSCMKRRASLPVMRRIRFATTSEVCVFEAPSSKKWYTNEDQRRFKRQRAIDAMSFRQQRAPEATMGPQNQKKQACPVGLEQMLSEEVMIQAMKSRKYVVRAVLHEQNRQKLYGLQDPDRIALLSFRFTAESLNEAVKRGKFQEIAKHV